MEAVMTEATLLGQHLSLPRSLIANAPEIDLERIKAETPSQCVLREQIEAELGRRKAAREERFLFPGMSASFMNGYGQD
ncbi:MAG: hypothetical protein Q7S15_00210 [bacterium]|nr:hypothetical protein [bacterium]